MDDPICIEDFHNTLTIIYGPVSDTLTGLDEESDLFDNKTPDSIKEKNKLNKTIIKEYHGTTLEIVEHEGKLKYLIADKKELPINGNFSVKFPYNNIVIFTDFLYKYNLTWSRNNHAEINYSLNISREKKGCPLTFDDIFTGIRSLHSVGETSATSYNINKINYINATNTLEISISGYG